MCDDGDDDEEGQILRRFEPNSTENISIEFHRVSSSLKCNRGLSFHKRLWNKIDIVTNKINVLIIRWQFCVFVISNSDVLNARPSTGFKFFQKSTGQRAFKVTKESFAFDPTG